jgi:putative salt-induced outer membrane protein YdiY
MRARIYILIYLLFFSITANADTLIMKDGSLIKGKLLKQEKNNLTVKTQFAGTITIKWSEVKEIQSDEPITVMLKNDELISTRSVQNTDNGISRIKKEGEQWQSAFATDHVAYINPDPWRLNQGYNITGIANVSLKSQHGNTVKDEFELDGNLRFRSYIDRYFLEGQLEHDTNKGGTTADNWFVRGRYDYFVSKQRYYGVELSFERDKFTDLELKTTIGPYVGHQFYESQKKNLGVDIGLVKVYENNYEDKDTDYFAMNWNVDFDQYMFKDITQFYHRQKGLWDFDETDKVTLLSWTGFRFPLQGGVVASMELEWEYDSKPSEGVDKSDTTYRFKLGYRW